MSWHSTYSPQNPSNDNRVAFEIDRVARNLATQAGENWDSMNSYPGFNRNRWRDQAEQLLKQVA